MSRFSFGVAWHSPRTAFPFQTAVAKDFPGTGYDLVTSFDCLHDMGDPLKTAAHVRQSLAADGTWTVVEPFPGDRIEDNPNPIGRIYYAASTMVCMPASKAQGGRTGTRGAGGRGARPRGH